MRTRCSSGIREGATVMEQAGWPQVAACRDAVWRRQRGRRSPPVRPAQRRDVAGGTRAFAPPGGADRVKHAVRRRGGEGKDC